MRSSVSLLTAKVNLLTRAMCNLPDMGGAELAKRARKARIRAGFELPGDAAKAIGCSRPLILRWESGDANRIGKYLLAAARTYRVNPDWLDLDSSDDGYPYAQSVQAVSGDETQAGYVRVPQLDMPAGAGPGGDMEQEPEIVRWLDVAQNWADEQFPKRLSHIRVLTARGDSMIGAGIMSGDLLFVDTGIKRYDGDGYYVIRFREGWQVKRLRADVISQKLEIVSMLTNREEAREVLPEQEQELTIGGKVAAWWTLRKH